MKAAAQVSKVSGVRLRAAAAADLPVLIRLHQEAFPRHTLTALGKRFLHVYYANVLTSGLAYLAEREEGPVGFVSGCLDPERWHAEFFRAYRLRIAVCALLATVRRPRTMLPRLWRRFFGARGPEASVHGAELASLAVTRTARRSGVGRALVLHFMEEAQSRGATGIYLGTRRTDKGAVEFYHRLGFAVVSERPEPGGDVAYLLQYSFAREG